MTENAPIAAPPGLKPRGRKFWKEATKAYILRPDELIVLENACRCLDTIEDLAAAMKGQPLIAKGSMGQDREHPLLSEQRQQRNLLNRSLAQLNLPDEGAGASVNQHRQAAQSRWTHRAGA